MTAGATDRPEIIEHPTNALVFSSRAATSSRVQVCDEKQVSMPTSLTNQHRSDEFVSVRRLLRKRHGQLPEVQSIAPLEPPLANLMLLHMVGYA